MSVSKSGSKIASAKYLDGTIEIFDFDILTGIVSNPLMISGFNNAWGLEFSADGTKLYASQWLSDVISQFDITSNNLSTILNSETVVGYATGGSGYNAGFMQRGPNDMIYIAKWASNFLAVINQPNLSALNCQFSDNGVSLGSATSLAGLSRVVVTECTLTSFSELNNKNSGSVVLKSNKIFINLNNVKNNGSGVLTLYNSFGQIIFKSNVISKNGECVIEMPSQIKGVFLVNIEVDSFHFSKKIIRN